MDLYRVRDISTLTGVTRKTLFYYDRIGLLKPANRAGRAHQKLYSKEQLDRLKQIVSYREAGLSISEVKTLMDDPDSNHLEILHSALHRLEEQYDSTETQISMLKQMIIEMNEQSLLQRNEVL